MNKFVTIITLLILTVNIFWAQVTPNGVGTPLQKKFISGNLSEKAQVLRDSSGIERDNLCKNSIAFCLSYLPLLGSADEGLSTLAATALSIISGDYIDAMPPADQKQFLNDLFLLYTLSTSESQKIATLNCLARINLPSDEFTILLNKAIKDSSQSIPLTDSITKALGAVGNKESFLILFDFLDSPTYKGSIDIVKSSLQLLAQKPQVEIASFIAAGDINRCKKVFDLCVNSNYNKTTTSVVYHVANVAENVLLRAVYIAENTKKLDDDLIALSLQSFQYLANQKWTRATKTATRFFTQAVRFYSIHRISDNTFCTVIKSLPSVAPLDCVTQLAEFLTTTNSQKETGYTATTDDVLVATIEVLGNLGSKGAFDSLLSVTYYDYSANVLDAAKKSLAKLKW